MKDLEIYCITDKKINLSNKNYRIGWVGKEDPPSNYIQCNKNNNNRIFNISSIVWLK